MAYEVGEQEVRLIRKGTIRKRIPLCLIKSVHNQRGTVILHAKSFWRSSYYLHPSTSAAEFAEAVETELQDQAAKATS